MICKIGRNWWDKRTRLNEVEEEKELLQTSDILCMQLCAYANVFAFTIETQMNNYTLRKMLQEVIILS